ncbi:MAG: hypothetical protein ACRC62_37005 [Microcoleus sp.]
MSISQENAKGFYTAKNPVRRITIRRKGDSLWYEYDPSELSNQKTINAKSFEGIFVSHRLAATTQNDGLSCFFTCEANHEYYVFSYVYHKHFKQTGLGKFHKTLKTINPGAVLEIHVSPLNQNGVKIALVVNGEPIEWDAPA